MRSRAIGADCNERGERSAGESRATWTTPSLHARARSKGVNPLVYWLARAVLQPFFHLYWRLSRIGREHVPGAAP